MAATPAPSAPITTGSTPMPFRPGTPDDMARLREFLVSSGFTYAELKRRQQLADEARQANNPNPDIPDDTTDVLSALFNSGAPLSWDRVRRTIPAETLDLMGKLGLIENAPNSAHDAIATVMINPIAGLYLLSDHWQVAPGQKAPADVVFSPLSTNTQQFAALLPRDPCETALELCSGSGVAALMAARTAAHAWAVDITERSTRFAQFNAELNGIANVTNIRGDLYEPVKGQTFDRVVAHPPYMPAFEQELIFRDGGADGEQITRRIVAGLPEMLRPGGRLYCVCMATDRENASLETRVRGWLGQDADDFDIMFVELHEPSNPTGFYAMRAYESNSGFADLEARHRFFREARVSALVFGILIVQRRDTVRPTFTRRHRGAADTVSAQIEWALRWETEATDPQLPRRLADVRPRVSNHVAVRMTHQRRGGAFVPTQFEVLTETPFRLSVDCKSWLPTFLARCDGTVSVADHLTPLKAKGIMGPNVSVEEFAVFVMDHVGLGILEVPGHEIPPASAPVQELSSE